MLVRVEDRAKARTAIPAVRASELLASLRRRLRR
jgi:hypothetical protein